MPTVSSLKATLQDQISPSNDEEFLRLLNEADIRLQEWVRFRWTRTRVTLTPVDGLVYLDPQYAGILGAQVGGLPVDIRDESFEFVAGGVGDVPVDGCGGVMLIDEGVVDYVVSSVPTAIKVTGDFTLNGEPFVFPESIPRDGPDMYGRPSFYLEDEGFAWYSERAVDPVIGLHWNLGQEFKAFLYSLEDVATPDLVTEWLPYIGNGYPDTLVGTPLVELVSDIVLDSRRCYKVTGHLPAGTTIRAWVNYAPLALYDPDIEVVEGASATTRCPSLAALKLAMIGITLEEANQMGESRKYFATALQNLSSKEGKERAGARPQMNVRKGAGARRIRNFR